jgi:hypothetical protein
MAYWNSFSRLQVLALLSATIVACGNSDEGGSGFSLGTGYTPQDAAPQLPIPPGAGPEDAAIVVKPDASPAPMDAGAADAAMPPLDSGPKDSSADGAG